jgi:hypothetical protein
MTMRSDDKAAFEDFLSTDSNPEMPHLILNYSYFSSEKKAREAAERMNAQGFQVEVRRGADGVSWLALAKQVKTPTAEYIEEMRSVLEVIDKDLNGEYDGWEIEVSQT